MGVIAGTADGEIYGWAFEEEYRSLPPGGEILVPDGDWDYIGDDNISASGPKKVTIRSQHGKNNCRLKFSPGKPSTNHMLFQYSDLIRIFDLTGINSNPKGDGEAHMGRFGLSSSDVNTNIRVDHCDLLGFGYDGYNGSGAFRSKGLCHGVVDNNFWDNEPTINGWGYCWQNDGDNIWLEDISHLLGIGGIGKLLFFEDNKAWHARHFVANNRGARACIRKNEIEKGVREAQLESHAGYGDYSVGTVYLDIYDNDIGVPVSCSGKAMGYRGGRLRVHGNRCYSNGAYKNLIEVMLSSQVPYELAVKYAVKQSYVWDNEGDYTKTLVLWTNAQGIADIKLEKPENYEFPTYPHPLRNEGDPLKGDLTGDGKVNSADITELERIIAEGQ